MYTTISHVPWRALSQAGVGGLQACGLSSMTGAACFLLRRLLGLTGGAGGGVEASQASPDNMMGDPPRCALATVADHCGCGVGVKECAFALRGGQGRPHCFVHGSNGDPAPYHCWDDGHRCEEEVSELHAH